jgi:hypothetical protein
MPKPIPRGFVVWRKMAASSSPVTLNFFTLTYHRVEAESSFMFTPFYTLYAMVVAIAIVIWIVIRRLE